MSAQLRKPTVRECELCGRKERWDGVVDAWQLASEDGKKLAGNPHCLHEWDINGTFKPLGETVQ